MPLHALLVQIFKEANIDPASLTQHGNLITCSTSKNQFFAKVGKNTAQMKGESEGLRLMALTCPSLVPRLLGFQTQTSSSGTQAAMVSEYFDLGSAQSTASQAELGRKLAQMHVPPPEGTEGSHEGRYGFGVPTHCGVTEQDNTWEQSWEVFFRERRLGDMVRRIRDPQVTQAFDRLKDKAIPLLLGNIDPAPRPVILHGDLWSGNVGYDRTTGRAVIYDCSSYFGHNEADLGITHMFGGFSNTFYDEYHKVHPKSEPHYDQRQRLYELYHHLNHTLMFGGMYKSGAMSIMRELTDWAEGAG